MSARLREADIARRLGDWLADRAHAEAVGGHVADAAVELADTLRDEDVQGVMQEQVSRGLDTVPLATSAKVLAMTSLFFWMGAITAGRLMAYFGPVSGAPGLRNTIP